VLTSRKFLGRNHALKSRLENSMDWLALAAGSLGAVSLILLAVLDTRRHASLHKLFLALFMLGSNPPDTWFYRSLRTNLTM